MAARGGLPGLRRVAGEAARPAGNLPALRVRRAVVVDGAVHDLKTDLRCYTYDGQIQLIAARLYSGQTTNFRTAGGGFAPVFISGTDAECRCA